MHSGLTVSLRYDSLVEILKGCNNAMLVRLADQPGRRKDQPLEILEL